MFGALGFLPSLFGALVYQYLPWLIPVSGTIVMFMGIVMIFGLQFPSLSISSSAPRRVGLGGFVLYGIAYGMATLGCSAPIFLSVVMFALSSGGFLESLVAFIHYALGMGLTLVALSIIFVKAGEPMLRRFVGGVERLRVMSGVLLIVTGLYLIYHFFAMC